MQKWCDAHLHYLSTWPIELGTFSRKTCFLSLIAKQNASAGAIVDEEEKHRSKKILTDSLDALRLTTKTSAPAPKKGNSLAFQPRYPYEDDVEVKKSTIKNGGMGVFARVAFRKGQVIGRYVGRSIPQEKFSKLPKEATKKIISIVDATGRVQLIDGSDSKHFSSFINHKWSAEGNPLGACSLLVTPEGYFKTLRPIATGEELFIDYGMDYWSWQLLHKDLDECHDTAAKLRLMAEVVKALPN